MKSLKFSQFNLYSFNSKKTLIRNTFHDSVVRIENKLLNKIKKDLNKKEINEVKNLEKYKILVPKNKNEFKEWKKFVEEVKENKILSMTIAPTFACNFRCVYCIEEGKYVEMPSMKEEKIKEIFNFFDKIIKQKKIKKTNLILYGGEPILRYDLCLKIMKKFNEFSKKNKLKIEEIQIVTNGSLLDKKKINNLIKNGLERVMITVDGLKKTHNKRRKCPSNPNTFDMIITNIIYLAKQGVEVTVLSVTDSENINELLPLVRFFSKKLRNKDKIKKKIVFTFGLVAKTSCTRRRYNKLVKNKETEIRTKIITALKFAKKQGFLVGLPHEIDACEREDKYGFLIDPKGNIFKCVGVIGIPKYSIGNIKDSPNKIFKNMKKYTDLKILDEECKKCSILPLCRGGCQHDALMKFGVYGKKKFCEKDSLLKTYQEYLKQGLY